MANKYFPIGAHISIGKGYAKAFEEAVSIGAFAVQIFAKSPMMARLRLITEQEADDVKNYPQRNLIKYAVIHASYMLNFARPFAPDSFQFKSLVEDIKNSEMLLADGVIVHMGKSLDMEIREAKKNFVKNIKAAIALTANLKSKIILEMTAGQGSELGYQIEELSEIYKAINDERVKICIDTAHAFGGGYDLRDKKETSSFIEGIDKIIGLQNVACVHFNDSKKHLNSRVDRHEDIGQGTIGINGLKNFFKEMIKRTKKEIPFILETTEQFLSYKKQIEIMRGWL